MMVLGPLLGTLLQATTVHAQWNISMRAMQNPLPVGQCTAIEVVVKDPNGYAPLRPNGSQLDWQDFELTFTAASPDAFAWSNEKHRFLCARAPTAASATVIAHYPGSQLKPNQIVAGVDVTQSVEVAMQGVQAPATTAAVSDMPQQPPGYGPPGSVSPGTVATGYGPGGSSSGQGVPQTGVYPTDPGTYAGQQVGVYGPPGAVPSQPAPYGAPTDPNLTGTGPTVAGQPQMATNSKQFIQKITTHAKMKAREVAAHTVDATAEATNEVVDTTLEAGSQVVKSNMQSTAGSVGEAGKALVTGGGDPGDTKDVAGGPGKRPRGAAEPPIPGAHRNARPVYRTTHRAARASDVGQSRPIPDRRACGQG